MFTARYYRITRPVTPLPMDARLGASLRGTAPGQPTVYPPEVS